MSNEKSLVMDIKDLVVHYETDEGVVEAVNNVSLQILLEQEVIVGIGRVCVGAVHHADRRADVIVQID